jgi:hypothetical protein
MHPSVGPLPPGSLLSLYCPHIREGIATAPSNQHSIETFAIATGVIGDDVNSIIDAAAQAATLSRASGSESDGWKTRPGRFLANGRYAW